LFRTIPTTSISDKTANRSAPPDPVRRVARAKVNLCLRVHGRRSDGYHLIESLVVFAEIGDLIEVRPAEHLSLAVDGPFASEVPTDDDNLVLRAARTLGTALNSGAGAALRLRKCLPVAAGLGGGSADAAATLKALQSIWRHQIDDAAVSRLALELGADLPVCLAARPSIMTGIGEVIRPIDKLPAVHLVLANPGCRLSTAAVYRRLGQVLPAPPPASLAAVYPNSAALAEVIADLGNDLEEPARQMAPEIDRVLDRLNGSADCLAARMSGSGPTCFGMFATEAGADAAARAIGVAEPGWWVRASAIKEVA
jgi:4-diphosphocytidyl-2-C-methyl-D-erythritol kinase